MKRVAVVLVVLSGCAAPTTPPPTTTRPSVDRALDVSRYSTSDTVCDIIPPGLDVELKFSVSGSGGVLPENPTCHTSGAIGRVQLFTTTDRLARAYAMDRTAQYPRFVEGLTIAGQPAAHVQADESDIGRQCLTVVALSETSSLEVQGLYNDACVKADRLAGAIVAGLG